MFRTARGFLISTPPAFLLGLVSFLAFHPRAVDAYTTYPVLLTSFGQALSRQPTSRFIVTALVFFVFPYLVIGLLLFLADLGIAAAAPLWTGKRRKPASTPLPSESRFGYFGGLIVLSLVIGALLHRVSHGGELPGGISVAPIMVAAVPFLACIGALFLAGLFSLPRILLAQFSNRPASGRSAA